MIEPGVTMAGELRTTLLLTLPGELENAFWRDARTIKAYTMWDVYSCVNLLVSNLIMAKAMARLMTNMSILHLTWHIHFNLLVTYITCISLLAMVRWAPDFYRRNRHKVIVINRLLRVGLMLLTTWQASPALQAAVGAALKHQQPPQPPGGGHESDAANASLLPLIITITKPLFMAPLITMAHGNWVFAARFWLPLQMLTHATAYHGAQRHQPCRIASDPSIAWMLQPTCDCFTRLHKMLAGSLLGCSFMHSLPFGDTDHPPACRTAASSAQTLVWYAQATYGVLMPAAGFVSLEWRLKVAWTRMHLRRHLSYGPFGWPSSKEYGQKSTRVQHGVEWLVVIAVALWLLWYVALLVVPLLPHLPCTASCDDADKSCNPPAVCEGILCQDPGLSTAAMFYLQLLFALIGHLAVTRFMY